MTKSGVFRLQTVVTSNVAFFAQNFPYVLPRTRRRYWLRALQQRVPRSFLLYPRKTTIFLLVSTNKTRNGILYYDMEAIWKRAQHNWKCHIEKILPPEFFRLTFPSMKQDWLHGFKDRLIAQKGPPRRTLLIPKMGSKMSRLQIWVTFANIYVSQRQMPQLQKLTI